MNQPPRNIKLCIAYDGTDFSGWQRQKHDRTIQGDIESCLKRMTRNDISLHSAGRTDAGVHAEEMTAHFKTLTAISPEDFHHGLNSMLDGSIRVLTVNEVAGDFHARFNAKGKKYRYTIFTGPILPPTKRLYSLHIKDNLNLETIQRCLQKIEGTHDFSAFENTGSRDKNNSSGRGAIRTIFEASLSRTANDFLFFNFVGDGFLRCMVRNLTGTLLAAGRGRLSTDNFDLILHSKDRNLAGTAAPAHALSLIKVYY